MAKQSSSDYFKGINQDNLEKASAILAQWGYSVSEAVDIFLYRPNSCGAELSLC